MPAIVAQIFELARPIAQGMGLGVVDVVFQTNHSPPVLRVDIAHPQQHISLQDCERMSRRLETVLDATDIIPGAYVLEVSSPGTTRALTSEREFKAFQGFAVVVQTNPPHKATAQWRGRLQGRDETTLYLNRKGKTLAIPLTCVTQVQLDDLPA